MTQSNFTSYLDNVACKSLRVDYNYQRPIEGPWLKKIIKNFDISYARTLYISKRANGDLYVVDGNHTRMAAMEVIGDDVTLPAKIYTNLTPEDEARLFEELNSNSRKVKFNEKLKASVYSGNEDSLEYVAALDASGINWKYLTSYPGAFCAHQGGMRLFHRYAKDIFIDGLKILKRANDNKLIRAQVLGGICYLLEQTPIEKKDLAATIESITNAELEVKTRLYGKTTHDAVSTSNLIYARALLELHNKKKRRNKIILHAAG